MPWPRTAARDVDGRLTIGGVALDDLADRYGTPLWVLDEADLRWRCRAHRAAFPGAEVTYASKAWCTIAVLQVVRDEGLWVDVASGGELATALAAGVPADRLVVHGNNKSVDELRAAAEAGAGRIVVDSHAELDRLEALGRTLGRRLPAWLRITPGIAAQTHESLRTGHDDSKFGFSAALGLADAALEHTRRLEHVELRGVHSHLGSQITEVEPFVGNATALVGLLARWRDDHGVNLGELNLGGGLGIAHAEGAEVVDLVHLGAAVLRAVAEACAHYGLDRPRLWVEPGRAIVGPAGVTVYRVGTIKDLPGVRSYVSVDGGMSDNIRPALYGANHEVVVANRTGTGEQRPMTVVGKHCESGDLVREAAALPADLRIGDLLAVAATGAYTAAMASNYNRLPRPAAVMVRDATARVVVRRETVDDLLSRDVALW